MTDEVKKWRSQVDRLLAAPIARNRSMETITGKVDDRFESIFDARRRGMGWVAIAGALDAEGKLNQESVESAFRRLCEERGVSSPKPQRAPMVTATSVSAPQQNSRPSVKPASPEGSGAGERWVDDGDE
jgi:hypothetical protein